MDYPGRFSQVQVEALSECLDFLKNGYRQVFAYDIGCAVYIKLKHKDNGNIITLVITERQYSIRKNGEKVKEVCNELAYQYFTIEILDDLSLRKHPTIPPSDSKLVPRFDLTNIDAG